jgi:hypothetical protein
VHLVAVIDANFEARQLLTLDVAKKVQHFEARLLLPGWKVQAVDGVHGNEQLETQALFEELGDLRNLGRFDDSPGIAGSVDVSLGQGNGQLGCNLVQREGAHEALCFR